MFKFSQNRLLFQWPSKYARTVYQKYREKSGKYRGKIPGLYTENTGKAIGIIPVSKSSFTREEKV